MHMISCEDEALEVSHLSVNYDRTPVLWDISLKVPKGKLIGIIGPNGAGKSTLIKSVLGLTPKLSGKVSFFGRPLNEVQKKVAYVPQRESVDWDFPITVRNLVLMGRYGRLGLFRRPRSADYAAVDHYLESVGMAQYGDRQISQLSGGQQQRAFLARALLQEAEIYFLDEPFSGIDKASEKVIVEIVKKLRDRGKTLFIVHHDLSVATALFDWLILINMRLVASGPAEEVFTEEYIDATYGKSHALFDEVVKLSEKKSRGIES